MQMQLRIVTPEGIFLDAMAVMIEFPTTDGILGILPGHVPLMTDLTAGELRVIRSCQTDCFAIAGGYVEINAHRVQVVASFASIGEEEAAIEAACARARQVLETTEEEDPAVIEVELRDLKSELCQLADRKRQKRG